MLEFMISNMARYLKRDRRIEGILPLDLSPCLLPAVFEHSDI
jgi:hypothetical protein